VSKSSTLVAVGSLLAGACAHASPPDPLDVMYAREVHARWSIVDRPAPPDAIDWHNPIQVSLVVDGQVIDATQGTACAPMDTWIGTAHPLSNVHCKFMGPGDSNVGAFRDGDALIVRVQWWEPTDAVDGPPKILEEERGRITLPASGKLVFDAPR
jgi:hypothetical protein